MVVENVPKVVKERWASLELDTSTGLVTCIDNDGYKAVTNLKKLQKGNSPRIYSKDNPYTIENINNYLRLSGSSVTVLSRSYINRDCILKIWCNTCQKESERPFNLLRKTPKCETCAKYNVGSRHSIGYIREELSKYHPTLRLESDKYIDNKTELELFCSTCNSIVYAPWKTLVSGIGCNNCAKEKSKKVFDKNQANKNKEEWATIPATVYIIHCTGHAESFYKVGMTTIPVTRRFNNQRSMPYNFKVVKEIQTNKYEGTFIEKDIQEKLKDKRYTPSIKFGGHTECFSDLGVGIRF